MTIKSLIVSLLFVFSTAIVVTSYQVGVGIGDITGPIVEINFLGYANPSQKGSGLHLRQYARAYIVDDGSKRFAFVNLDTAMIGYFMRKKVIDSLTIYYGNTYNEQNFILSAVHTHSGPGGYMDDFLYDISTAGYVSETISAIHTGIIKAMIMAHTSMQPAKIYKNSGILLNANINRSPFAYLLNPQSERNEYSYDVDKSMDQLQFVATPSNTLLGVINWFPVHPNSMNNTNTLVSSDNAGYASIKLEQLFNQNSLIGKGPFIASFASTNLGDVSPNLKGPHCIDTGLPCDDVTSSCNGKSQTCIAFGPGNDMFESTEIIGTRLYEKALDILNQGNRVEVTGEIRFGHRYVDMSNQIVNYTLANGTQVMGQGCVAALGYSFAAGTTDGPGMFDFTQSTTSTNPFWNLIRLLLANPTNNDIKCQDPKPILFNTGGQGSNKWQPNVVSVQVVILGNLILAAVPSEFTTMSGRRLKKSLQTTFSENGGSSNGEVIVLGLCNSYTSYVTTYEEYQLQRYEGASTLYGPHTLGIYQELYKNLLKSVLMNTIFDKGSPDPQYENGNNWSFTLPVVFDTAFFNSYGACLNQPKSSYQRGKTVVVVFKSSNPRSGDLSTYSLLSVKKLVSSSNWQTIATDANWETKYEWKRVGVSESKVTIKWYIRLDEQPGTYKISHFGYYKPIFGSISSFSGTSNSFTVI